MADLCVRRLSPEVLVDDHGISCRELFPADEDGALVGFTWAEVPPNGATAPHSHNEPEAFVIASGTGRIDIEGDTTTLGAGDAVFIPAGARHALANTGEGTLSFVAIWWDRSLDRDPVHA